MSTNDQKLPAYRHSLAGTLLAAREAMMAPIRPYLREAGVTEQQWRVLRVLDESDSDPTALAEAALLFAPSVTRILKDLVDRDLIVRRADPQDGRRSILSLTPAGRALIRKTSRRTVHVLESYAEHFGAERLAKLQSELLAFARAIAAAHETE
ncbi:MAG: MarR family transcriptional regulator [Alphaproteobacteria bacterium]|nr:MarR family transcriptional regulator [Alphaproteobacteria bacterium]MBU6474236.1 MarR family transcriptional regulator [Alphaproteobacteria bacterium]MDE2013180.1 MarR family transcriptional regulator [Alphaproteobacteria bacterium]MDE2073170.1 MarR family transcriptional regulator [Alphaproteobacteria bacterium]